MNNYVLKYQIIRLVIAMIPSAEKRTRIIKKTKFFKEMGDNVHFQPRHLPADPKFIILHDNVAIASNVWFINHDIMHKIFNCIDPTHNYQSHLGCIEIMDNVFIGSNTTILPNVRIGPNVVVAAGSVITKDIPAGVIVGGVPARVIGTFDQIMEKRQKEASCIEKTSRIDRVEREWERFNKKRNNE